MSERPFDPSWWWWREYVPALLRGPPRACYAGRARGLDREIVVSELSHDSFQHPATTSSPNAWVPVSLGGGSGRIYPVKRWIFYFVALPPDAPRQHKSWVWSDANRRRPKQLRFLEPHRCGEQLLGDLRRARIDGFSVIRELTTGIFGEQRVAVERRVDLDTLLEWARYRGWLDFSEDDLRVAVDQARLGGRAMTAARHIVDLWICALPELLRIRDRAILAEADRRRPVVGSTLRLRQFGVRS